MMFEELMHFAGEPGDPVTVLIAASMVRDEMPWMYELAMEVYRAAKSGDRDAMEREVRRLHRFSEVFLHGPFMREFGFADKESHMFFRHFPMLLERMMMRALETTGGHPGTARKPRKTQSASETTQ